MAAITLPALGGTARAQDNGCSNATLQGAYAFSVLTVATPGGPNVVVGLGTFDGKGGFSQIDYPGDGLRTSDLTKFRTGQTGSYAVNPDCTGFQEINLGGGIGVIENAFVISDGGRSIHAVVAEFTIGGTAVPVQTQVSFWKVGSDQNN
jgi:hypothetical protein